MEQSCSSHGQDWETEGGRGWGFTILFVCALPTTRRLPPGLCLIKFLPPPDSTSQRVNLNHMGLKEYLRSTLYQLPAIFYIRHQYVWASANGTWVEHGFPPPGWAHSLVTMRALPSSSCTWKITLEIISWRWGRSEFWWLPAWEPPTNHAHYFRCCVVLTKYHRMNSLNNINVLLHSSEVGCPGSGLAGLIPSEDCEKAAAPWLFPRLSWFSRNL